MMPRIIARCLVCALLPTSLVAQTKPAPTPKDYGVWESLGTASLSPDGRWLAYGVNRVNEENELRLRGGPRDTSIVAPNASGATFSADSKWIAYAIGVSPSERERLEKEKKPVRNSLGFRSLATGEQTTVADVTSFRFSADGKVLAFRRYPAEGKRVADVLIQDLGKGTRLTIGNVSDYAWSESRQLLALTIETEGGAGNAIHLYDASTGVLRALDSSPSLYRALAWRPKSDDLAVLRSKPDKEFKDTAHVALVWTRVGSPQAGSKQLDPATAVGFPKEMRVAEHRRPEWSDDGTVLFLGLRPRERASQRSDTASTRTIVAQRDGQVRQAGSDSVAPVRSTDTLRAKAQTEKPSDVQVWHSRDVRIMPMQKVQEQQDLQRTLLTAWHLSDGHVVQIGTRLLETARPLEGAAFATETDRDRYEFGTMFGRPYQDIWLINVKTGDRRKVIEKARFFYGGSATGRKLLWYDGKHYWTQDVASGARVNVSEKVKASFANPDYDFPGDMTPPLGIAGWAVNDRAVLVNDAYDVWSLNPDGSGGTRLTNGAADGIVHRYARTGRDEYGIDVSKPLYFSISGKKSKKSGFARMTPGRPVERVVLEDARLSRLIRADSTDVFAYVRERFDDSPDWFVGGPDLTSARQRSETNASQKNFAWGRSELVDFKSTTGRDLQAALYYPANHDPSKKYPMIVYTYELLSQNVHGYVVPSERNYYSVAAFTANGYFVLTPDIVFRGRDPGMSTLEAVVPAVRAIVTRGLVDSTRVGHVGHSWGGYEATFLPTRTRMFAASVAGAPITNFLSFAGAIHWTPGIAEFDHWETGQARMDVPPWEDMDAYLRNSPIAKVHELRTPLLMEVGDADGTVDWHQGIEFYNFARRAGNKDFVLLVYPGEDHGLRKKENQIDYHRRIQQWFGHYLKGDPAPKWMTEGMTWLDRKTILDGGK